MSIRQLIGIVPVVVAVLIVAVGIVTVDVHAQLIPPDEVETLQTISRKLNNRFWKVSRNSCNDNSLNVTIADNILSNVTCDCSFKNNSVCHVTNIQLKGLNLTGPFPSEFGNLTHLQEIDLVRNYISGTIPTSLTKIPLVIFAVIDNIMSGSIPEELGQIPTLEELYLEDNHLAGPLPPSLGNLNRLRRLLLSANNFTGTIPESYSKLKNLSDFRIDSNNLSGKIPGFIGNWTNLTALTMLGSGVEGPIPSIISTLKNLTELSISDLKGPTMGFPNLKGFNNLRTLILRNCLLTGVIPDYVGDLTNLKTLDLSFNKLSGRIPDTLQNLQGLGYMFLLNNTLSGALPFWITNSKQKFDVSYNNFTGASPPSCQQANVNLVSSYSPTNDTSIYWCLQKNLPCPKTPKYYSFFINCGGGRITYDGNEYEEDLSNIGPSNFFAPSDKWAYSSSGYWMYNDKSNYVASNVFGLNVTGPKFYQTARTAPLSLKYYGLCLRQGSYKVKLHFAEIMFSDDQTFSGIGRRIFDVAIQGNTMLKDFNIAEAAGGVGKNVTVTFDDIKVNGSTLEISFYWAGKGTTAVPARGVYGPLISAITVTPNFKVNTGGLSVGAITGIVLGSVTVVALTLIFLRVGGYLGGTDEYKEFRGLDSYFSLKQIKAATEDFNPRNKIGEGGFGPVYKGVLADGKVIAVKQLSSKSKQGNREFVNEVGMISAIQHPNLVKLYGWCIEAKELLLVYEYMENNSLARVLFGRQDQRLNLDWPTRMKVCLGIARGLAYLHEESRLKIVHRDIKATNVLLDKDLNAKISDFGLAKLDEEEDTHISTRVAGTIGYMAPEYAMRGYLTDKADVYSFGVVVLEIVSGKSNTSYCPKEEFVYLLDWAYVVQEQGNILELVDPSLENNYLEEDALRMLNLALLCTNPSPTLRPRMSSVVSMIEGHAPVQAPIVKNSVGSEGEPRFKALSVDTYCLHSQISTATSSQNSSIMHRSISTDGPWMDSTTSNQSKDEANESFLGN